MVLTYLFLTSLFMFTCAGPVPRGMTVHEQRMGVPAGFVRSGLTASNVNVTLRIALKQNNISGLEAALYDVSTPSSNNYGQHLSKEEVCSFLAH